MNQKLVSVVQGFSARPGDRLPLMPREAMTPAQRDAADELIAGPRKAVFGPFIPLLRSAMTAPAVIHGAI